MASLVVCVVVTYSDSAVESVTIFCFLEDQETAPPSIRNVYPVIACLCSCVALSASVNPSKPFTLHPINQGPIPHTSQISKYILHSLPMNPSQIIHELREYSNWKRNIWACSDSEVNERANSFAVMDVAHFCGLFWCLWALALRILNICVHRC